MKYISTRKNDEQVSFKEAVINGLTNNGGLYFPDTIPELPQRFFEEIESYSEQEIAFKALRPFTEDSLTDEQLKNIVSETINFPLPVIDVAENVFSLELFHGPTKAFKDVGARFMSRCLSVFNSDKKEAVTILVATSGDTGSAVANGFFDVSGVSVKILFPKGKVSPYQEHQMTSLGKNIHAIEVDGTFDDCQKLVKQALNDTELKQNKSLSSANSINVARFLPQMLYYFFAYKQLKNKLEDKKLIVSVPSGNLGNITAGLIAKKMGLPIHHFVAAHNRNDTFFQYIETGELNPKSSVLTYSNAMDVGNPSNFERIAHMYGHSVEAARKDISSYRFEDDETLEEIKNCHEKNNYLLDPHGAVGKLALDKMGNKEDIKLFLETAHPQKFASIIKKVFPEYKSPVVDLQNCKKTPMDNDYESFKELIKKES